MPNQRFRERLPLTAMFFAILPALMIVALFGYATQARLYLGHWPSYNNPDPKNLGWFLEHAALQLGFILFPFLFIGSVVLAIVGRMRTSDFPLRTIVGIAIICAVLLIAYCRVDPGGFVEWFWD